MCPQRSFKSQPTEFVLRAQSVSRFKMINADLVTLHRMDTVLLKKGRRGTFSQRFSMSHSAVNNPMKSHEVQ